MKKGFTLIELLGVFTIMTVIMLVSVPIVTGMMKTAEEQKYENFKNNVFLSAEAYINDHMDEYPDMKTIGGYDYVYFSQLIENDYLNSTVYDPKTGLNVDEELDYTVIATVQDNYTYSYTLSTVKLVKDTTAPIITSLTVDDATASFTVSDNYELQGYAVTASTSIPTVWNDTGAVITYSNTHTSVSAGTYYLHVIDYNGNTVYQSFVIESSAFCAYTAGNLWNFAYNGSIQNFTVPCSGIYKLEVWGAQGGPTSVSTGGAGGYSVGNTTLNVNTTLYIVVGGSGNIGYYSSTVDPVGGYNGGGTGDSNNITSGEATYGGSGGGATHIAKVTGTLAAIGYTSGVTNGNLLIVAGGGGAAGARYGWPGPTYSFVHTGWDGGTGGGLTGGTGGGSGTTYYGYGGTQTAGGTSDYGGIGSFGQGATSQYYGGGGGGGLFGGGGRYAYGGAGGGSGYLSSALTSTSMTNGVRSGNGYARVTLVSIN